MASILLYRSVKTMACRLSMAENPLSGLLIAYLILLSLGRPCSAADVEAVKLRQTVTLGIEEPLSWTLKDLPESLHADATLGLLRSTLPSQAKWFIRPKKECGGCLKREPFELPREICSSCFPRVTTTRQAAARSMTCLPIVRKMMGSTWQGPRIAFDIAYSQHGFIPLIPQAVSVFTLLEPSPFPTNTVGKKGASKTLPLVSDRRMMMGIIGVKSALIHPLKDPGFLGMSVTRMTETRRGTWILGAHAADWSKQPLETEQYLLRSTDKGASWQLLPGSRPNGWFDPNYRRMDEGRPIWLQDDEVFFMARTPSGRIWSARSMDDGQTWSSPEPTKLIHPDAPPMVFFLTDRKTLIAFHHNRHAGTQYTGLSGTMDGMKDRSEIWVSRSRDGGRHWDSPRFLFANACEPNPEKNGWFNHQVSYLDAVIDRGTIHLFCPHLWNRALHLTLREADLNHLPTKDELRSMHSKSDR